MRLPPLTGEELWLCLGHKAASLTVLSKEASASQTCLGRKHDRIYKYFSWFISLGHELPTKFFWIFVTGDDMGPVRAPSYVFAVVFFELPSRESTLIAAKCFDVDTLTSISAHIALRKAFSHGQFQ
jgi:hypothetical protein